MSKILRQIGCQTATVSWQQLPVGNDRNESRSATPSRVSQIQKQFSLSKMYGMQQAYSHQHLSALKRAES